MEGSFSNGTIARVGDNINFSQDPAQLREHGGGDSVGAGDNDCNDSGNDLCQDAMDSVESESGVETAPKKKKATAPKRGKSGTDAAQQKNATSPRASDCVNLSDGAAGKKKSEKGEKGVAPKSKGILKQAKQRPPARPHKRLSQDVLVSRIADMDGKKQVLESKLVLIKARLELHKNEMQFRQSESAQNDN